jgi:tetratricopeptide (TPR) repeat protein
MYWLFLRTGGAYEEAVQLGERAQLLYPGDWGTMHQLGISYRYAGDNETAAEIARQTIEINPTVPNPHVALAQAEAMLGNSREALEELRIANELGAVDAGDWRLAQMALVHVQIDDRTEAERLRTELESLAEQSQSAEASLALAHIALGEYEPALVRLTDAIETRSSNRIALSEIKSNYWGDPVLDTDPRFVELRERIFALN